MCHLHLLQLLQLWLLLLRIQVAHVLLQTQSTQALRRRLGKSPLFCTLWLCRHAHVDMTLANMAATYPGPSLVIHHPESLAAQAADPGSGSRLYCPGSGLGPNLIHDCQCSKLNRDFKLDLRRVFVAPVSLGPTGCRSARTACRHQTDSADSDSNGTQHAILTFIS